MVKMFYLNVKDGNFGTVEIEPTLQEYYKLLGCTCIDMVARTLKNEAYDIILDDEGLLKGNPVISSVDSYCNPMTVGNLLFTRCNEEGVEIGITDDDVKNILSCIGIGFSDFKPEGYPLIVGLNY